MRQLFCVSAIYLVWYHIFYTVELFLYCFPVESTRLLLILVNRYAHHTCVSCVKDMYIVYGLKKLPCCAGGRILSWNLTLHGHHCGNNMLSMFTFSTSLRFEYPKTGGWFQVFWHGSGPHPLLWTIRAAYQSKRPNILEIVSTGIS